jgi:hypothetical protein
MNLREALLRQRVRFRQSAGNRQELQLCCPFCIESGHSDDVGYHLGVNAGTGAGMCFRCGRKSRYMASMLLRQLKIDTVVNFDNGAAPQTEEAPPVALPKDFTLLGGNLEGLDFTAQKYLTDRGVTLAQIRECGIGVSYIGRYAYRIVFPVWVKRVLKGIVARDFTSRGEPKYLNSPGEKWLFHFDPEAEACVLSEGAFKALRIQQVFTGSSTALLGHDLTPAQLKQIVESKCKQITLYPDPDVVGRRGVVTIADKLQEGWDGEVRVACSVSAPADEDSLESLSNNLKSAARYSWAVRQQVML